MMMTLAEFGDELIKNFSELHGKLGNEHNFCCMEMIEPHITAKLLFYNRHIQKKGKRRQNLASKVTTSRIWTKVMKILMLLSSGL